MRPRRTPVGPPDHRKHGARAAQMSVLTRDGGTSRRPLRDDPARTALAHVGLLGAHLEGRARVRGTRGMGALPSRQVSD